MNTSKSDPIVWVGGGGLTALDIVHSEGIVMRHNISLGRSNLPPPIRLDHCPARNNYQSKVKLDIALEHYDEDSIQMRLD